MTRARVLANFGSTDVTSAEIDKLDGFTGTADDLNYAKDLRSEGVTTTEFDQLDTTSGTASASTFLRGDKTWGTPSGGTEVYDAWALNASVSGQVNPVTSWQRADGSPLGVIGTGMTHSSGTFSFPETGYWHVTINCYGRADVNNDSQCLVLINCTTNNSSYTAISQGVTSAYLHSGLADFGANTMAVVDVTDISNVKIQFQWHPSNTSTSYADGSSLLYSSSSSILTYATFSKLADT